MAPRKRTSSKDAASLAPKKKRGAPKGGSPKTAPKAPRDKIRAEAAAELELEPVYDEQIAAIILRRLARGETLNSICKTEGMPPHPTVRRWALDDVHDFAAKYSRARELGYHAMADELIDIMDDGRNDWMERHDSEGNSTGWQVNGEHVQRSRLRVEGRKWLLSKALPKIYGDKLALTDADGGSLKIQMVA
jgi:hypothetical protein